MKRNDILFKFLNFGKNQEKELIEKGKRHKAYKIEHARNEIVYYLFNHTIKETIDFLHKMTFYKMQENGFLDYDGLHFVADDDTRKMLVDLKRQITGEWDY